MSEMKPCFGKELAARFSPGTAPIGVDPAAARCECHACGDFDRCSRLVGLVLQLRKRE